MKKILIKTYGKTLYIAYMLVFEILLFTSNTIDYAKERIS